MRRSDLSREPSGGNGGLGQRAAVLRPSIGSASLVCDNLNEAISLARAIGLDVTFAETVRLNGRRPATLFGAGKLDEFKRRIADSIVEIVIVDGQLTPVQQRNLERFWQCKVLDRTGLILEIFGDRAKTREGSLQVELASLSYQRSRLVRSWTHLERQRGGFGFLGGPGESQLESDRRHIDERIARIRQELESVIRTRTLHRSARKRVPYFVISLVGYTNAGKSTLFNHLTGAETVAEDKLFATLDPTLRGVTLPSGRRVIISDTVGFVSNLPTHLVAAFRATLEEVCEADIIVHVRDISHPECEAQKSDVHGVLESLGLADRVNDGLIEVLNKVDAMEANSRDLMASVNGKHAIGIAVSALTGEGCDALLSRLDETCASAWETVSFSISHADGRALAWLYRHGEVVSRTDDDSVAHIRVRLDRANLARFHHLQSQAPT